MCSSTRSAASQSRPVSTPVSRPRPWRDSTSDSRDAVQGERERIHSLSRPRPHQLRRQQVRLRARFPPPPGRRTRRAARWRRRCCGRARRRDAGRGSVGSLRITRVAPSSGSRRACSGRAAGSRPDVRGCRRARRGTSSRRRRSAPASRRLETSFNGSCSRKTSTPFSAAHATKRCTMSAATGFRADQEAAAQRDPEGVSVRADRRESAPTGSPRRGGLPRRTLRRRDLERGEAGPVEDAAIRRSSPVGTFPASGSCESRRIVVSTSCGTGVGRLLQELRRSSIASCGWKQRCCSSARCGRPARWRHGTGPRSGDVVVLAHYSNALIHFAPAPSSPESRR